MAKRRTPDLDDAFRPLRIESDADWQQWRQELLDAEADGPPIGMGSIFGCILRGINHLRANRELRIEDHVMLDMIGVLSRQIERNARS